MGLIRISNVGGIMPSMSARALPDNAAQKSDNLYAGTPEFRPLLADVQRATSGVTNPKTLYRLARKADGSFNIDMTTGWVVDAAVVQYVKGQLDDDNTERTYYTFDDGHAPPRAMDATGNDRQLGVPAPAGKLTGTVNTVDEFTEADKTTALDSAKQLAIAAFDTHGTFNWVGMTHPGTSTSGLVDRDTLTTTSGNGAQVLRVFKLSTANGDSTGVITDTYSSLPVDQASWVFDPALSGFFLPSTGGPAWSGGTNEHYCIPLSVYGKTYVLDATAATTDLTAIPMPGTTDGTKLFTSAQVTEMVTFIQGKLDPASTTNKPLFDALQAKASDVLGMLDGSQQGNLVTQVENFYSTTAAGEITSAIAAFAEAIWQKAYLIANAQSAADYAGGLP